MNKIIKYRTNRFLAWGAFLFWLGLIFYLSTRPAFVVSQQGTIDNLAHILAHMTEYGILAALSYNLFSLYFQSKPEIISFVFSSFYALTDEYHQSFVPSRDSSWQDILCDVTGIILVLIVLKYSSFLERNEK